MSTSNSHMEVISNGVFLCQEYLTEKCFSTGLLFYFGYCFPGLDFLNIPVSVHRKTADDNKLDCAERKSLT